MLFNFRPIKMAHIIYGSPLQSLITNISSRIRNCNLKLHFMVKTKGNCFILFTHFYVAFHLWSKPTNLLVSLWLQGMNGYWGNLAQEQRQRPLGHWSLAPCWIHLLLQHSWKCQHSDYMNFTKISHHLSEFYTILQCHKGKLCAVFILGLQHVQGLRIINPSKDYSTPALQNQNSVASLLLCQPTGKRYLVIHVKRHMDILIQWTF